MNGTKIETTRNIFITTLSTMNIPRINIYEVGKSLSSKTQGKRCFGISQQEFGVKYALSTERIDKIVAICSEKVFEKEVDKFFEEQIVKFCKGEEVIPEDLSVSDSDKEKFDNYIKDDNKKLVCFKENENKKDFISFISDVDKDGNDNINEIFREIFTVKKDGEKKLRLSGNIRLYVDTSGGLRTSAHIRNSIISLIQQTNSNVELVNILDSNYEPTQQISEIIDEKNRYSVADLTASISAFINYGKAAMIKKYYDSHSNNLPLMKSVFNIITEYIKADYGDLLEIKTDSSLASIAPENKLEKLINTMVSIDESISICDLNSLENSLKDLSAIIYNDDINKDSWSNEINNFALLKWMHKKGFIQQAITIVEAKFPSEFVKNGIFFYCYKNNEAGMLEKIRKIKNGNDNFRLEDTYYDNYFLRNSYEKKDFPHEDIPPSCHELKTIVDDKSMDKAIKNYTQCLNSLKDETVSQTKTLYYSLISENYGNIFKDMQALILYFYVITQIRNENNHASSNTKRCSFTSTKAICENFINLFEDVTNWINKYKKNEKDNIVQIRLDKIYSEEQKSFIEYVSNNIENLNNNRRLTAPNPNSNSEREFHSFCENIIRYKNIDVSNRAALESFYINNFSCYQNTILPMHVHEQKQKIEQPNYYFTKSKKNKNHPYIKILRAIQSKNNQEAFFKNYSVKKQETKGPEIDQQEAKELEINELEIKKIDVPDFGSDTTEHFKYYVQIVIHTLNNMPNHKATLTEIQNVASSVLPLKSQLTNSGKKSGIKLISELCQNIIKVDGSGQDATLSLIN